MSKDVQVRHSRAAAYREQMSWADGTWRILNSNMFLVFECVILHFSLPKL